MSEQFSGISKQFNKLNNSEFDTIPNRGWADYIPLIRDLATDLDLFNPETFNNGHPVFLALERTRWDMTKNDEFFVTNVIGYYQEHLAWRKAVSITRQGEE